MSNDKIYGNLFLSIGAMKAGTTWLYKVLSQHPELAFSHEKEIHYFYHRFVDSNILSEPNRMRRSKAQHIVWPNPNTGNIDEVRENLHWVTSYLLNPVDDHWFLDLYKTRQPFEYRCEFSNLSSMLPVQAWSLIDQKCDKLRVLYTMRDPIARLWSHTKFHLKVSGQIENLDRWGPDEFYKFLRAPHVWQNVEYGQVLRTLSEGLDRSKWMAVFYEDLHKDERGNLKLIEDFLGIQNLDYPSDLLSQRYAESTKRDMPEFFPDLVSDDVARIINEVDKAGFEPPESWTR